MFSSTSAATAPLDPITIKGYKFFNSHTGENILVKGIDYYPRPNKGDLDANSLDFFTEEYRHIWERDIPRFKELGLNAIRLYSVDPTKDHSSFMCALAEAGIYALVELASGSCPECAITRDEAPKCYPPSLKIRGEKVIKEFSRYTNTLAFSAGNEVNHFVPLGSPPQWNAPCLKKYMRDMRAYVSRCHHIRHIPIGLIMADSDREKNTLYYNCLSDEDDHLEHAEWYGINTYVYCDGAAMSYDKALGFKALSDSFQSYHYSIPVLLTEYGCLSQTFPTVDGYKGQRNFNQAKWLGLSQVQNNFAGGMAFEYSIESSNAQTPFPYKEFGNQNYGVGYFSPENCDDVEIMCEYNPTPSFYNLKNAYAQAHAENITMDEFVPSEDRIGRTTCPSQFPKLSSFHWEADGKISSFCPRRGHDIWTCPAPVPTQPTKTSSELALAGIPLLLLFLLISGVLYILRMKKFRTSVQNDSSMSDDWDVEKETESNATADDEASALIYSKDGDGTGSYLSMSSDSS